MTGYSFDAGAFVHARRDLFPPAVFPTLWTRVEESIAAGELRAIDVVRDELAKRDDDVSAWAKTQPGLFVPLETDVQTATKNVLRACPGTDTSGADAFVAGYALARGLTVVSAGRSLPGVCREIGVPCRDFLGFLTERGWTF